MSKKVAHFSVFIWRISEKLKYGLIKVVLFFQKSLTGWISSAILSLIMSGKNKRLKNKKNKVYVYCSYCLHVLQILNLSRKVKSVSLNESHKFLFWGFYICVDFNLRNNLRKKRLRYSVLSFGLWEE